MLPPDAETEVTQDAPDDIRSLISSAFDEHISTPEAETVEEKPSGERPRDQSGRFAKVETESVEDTEAEVVLEEPVAVVVEPPAAEPPHHWAATDKEAFKELTPKAQAAWLRRDQEMTADYTKKTTEIAEFRRDYEPVRQMMAPFEQQIRAAGFTPATLIQAWADVERKLTQGQGVAVVKDLIQNYRLDRAQLARELGLSQPTDGTPPAPDGHAPIQLPPELTRTLDELRQQQGQFNQYLTRQQQEQQREATNRVMSTITAFRDAKDQTGNLLHPHYEELENDMVLLANAVRASGQEPDLKDLYDRAVWANTSTREKVLASQRAAESAQRTAAEEQKRVEARAKAEKARRAGSSVTGAPGASQAAIAAARAESGSLRDTLNAAFEETSSA